MSPLMLLVLLSATGEQWGATFPPKEMATYLEAKDAKVLVAAAGEPAEPVRAAATAVESALRGSGRTSLVMNDAALGALQSASDLDVVNRAKPFPVLRDLIVDRGALDRVIAAGGYVSASTGSAPDGNAIPVAKPKADAAMDAAACIGCGACVAACPNASAMLFVGATISHLGLLPQGQPERFARAEAMVTAMDREGFGPCTNVTECSAVCPKEIDIGVIARMNRDRIGAIFLVARRSLGADTV